MKLQEWNYISKGVVGWSCLFWVISSVIIPKWAQPWAPIPTSSSWYLTLPPLGGSMWPTSPAYVWLQCDFTGESKLFRVNRDFSGLCFADIFGGKWISEIFVNNPFMIPFWKIHTQCSKNGGKLSKSDRFTDIGSCLVCWWHIWWHPVPTAPPT